MPSRSLGASAGCAADPVSNDPAALTKTHIEAGRFDEAWQWLRRVRQREPDSAQTAYLEGHWHSQQGDLDRATPLYELAVRLAPEVPLFHRALGYCYMSRGDMQRGFEELEWRLVDEPGTEKRRLYKTPLWDGSSTRGQALLVHGEQGMGDIIQYARFVPELARRDEMPIYFVPPPSLARLLRHVDGMCPLALPGQRVPPHAAHLPLMSLPRLLGTRLDSIPSRDGYIRLGQELDLPSDGPRRLGMDHPEQLRVGVCWQGNPKYARDRYRSCGVGRFAELAEVPGVKLYALQFGDALRDLERLDQQRILRLTHMPKDYAGTAMILRHLDLVISVDTSLVHLAGAMGVPAWVMLPHPPDGRWLRDRDDSPWYASVKLYRQRELGDWGAPFEAVKRDLERLAQGARAPAFGLRRMPDQATST